MENKRPTKDEYYLGIAEAVSKRSTCLRRQYGAVLVKEDRIISTGYNGAPCGRENCSNRGFCKRESLGIPKGERYELCEAVHAEDNAISFVGYYASEGSTLYIVGVEVSTGDYANPSPCVMCQREILQGKISKVIGRAQDGSIIEIKVN